MRDILALPDDVFAFIWSNLQLVDILRLRQTCSTLSKAISDGKQIWAHIYDRDVKAKSLPIPCNLTGIDDASAHDIETLVKHAIALERRYENPGKLSFRKIGNTQGLGVTWLKLLRGRWCLIASANTEQSEISIWEIPSQGEVRLDGRVYLEGPVIDGIVDESIGHVHCALTIGASDPYILILGIFASKGMVTICPLANLPLASHVRFFHGRYIGFAVRSGDDTYPCVTEWEKGVCHELLLPSTNPLSPLPLEPCIAMTMKNDYVLSLHLSAVHIFAFSGTDSRPYAAHVATLGLQKKAYSGCFYDITVNEVSIGRSDPFACLYYQEFNSELRQAIVLCCNNSEQILKFTLAEKEFTNPPEVYASSVLTQYCLGISGHRIFCMTSLYGIGWSPSGLYTTPVRSKDNSAVVYHSIPKEGFPLLHITSALAFDDGNGLLLVGNMHGEVRLASFVGEGHVLRNGTWSDLPVTRSETSTIASNKVSEKFIQPDLPTFYVARKHHADMDNLPFDLIRRVTESWFDPLLGPLPFSDWSNDWSRFEYFSDWILPYSSWGPEDQDLTESPTTCARDRLQSLGDIIPVMYDTKNHRRVIFRIGQRLFHCRAARIPRGDDTVAYDVIEELEGDFDDEPDIILGVLPCTYAQFSSDPLSIITHVSDRSTQRNLRSRKTPLCCEVQSRAVATVRSIRNYQRSHGMMVTDDAMMEQWSNEQWNIMTDMCVEY